MLKSVPRNIYYVSSIFTVIPRFMMLPRRWHTVMGEENVGKERHLVVNCGQYAPWWSICSICSLQNCCSSVYVVVSGTSYTNCPEMRQKITVVLLYYLQPLSSMHTSDD